MHRGIRGYPVEPTDQPNRDEPVRHLRNDVFLSKWAPVESKVPRARETRWQRLRRWFRR